MVKFSILSQRESVRYSSLQRQFTPQTTLAGSRDDPERHRQILNGHALRFENRNLFR